MNAIIIKTCTCTVNESPGCPVGLQVGNHDIGSWIDDDNNFQTGKCPYVYKDEERPSWDNYFLQIANDVARRATCDRLHVGSVIVDERHRIISTGFNGAPSGMPHCSGSDGVGHELKTIEGRESCVRTLHAESNALDDAGRRARGGTLYVTVTPCYPCAQRLVNAGIVRIVYGEWYDSQNTDLVAEFLKNAGIDFSQG